jgi:osmotically inducible lipoprotein OsmB
MMRNGRVLLAATLLIALLGASACTKHMGVGAGVGAATGAGLGALSGGSILGGAATGAAVGAGGGYAYDKLKH